MTTKVHFSIKDLIFRFYATALLLTVFLVTYTYPQKQQVTSSRDTIKKIIADAGKHFRDGLYALKENKQSESRENFDKATEAFLSLPFSIQAEGNLQACYTYLEETVYNLEFPSNSNPPRVRNLAMICDWQWSESDYRLAEEITDDLLKRQLDGNLKITPTTESGETDSGIENEAGFKQQNFEPLSKDELSKQPTTDSHSGSNIRLVKAQAGDTVAKLAARHGADPIEVAKHNGLLPNSVLGAGRVISIPVDGNGDNMLSARIDSSLPIPTINPSLPAKPLIKIGPKPVKAKNGRIQVVMNYFNEVLHDPYSMRLVRWSSVTASSFLGLPAWKVSVKYRAKNLMGAYVLSERVFYIRNNEVVGTVPID